MLGATPDWAAPLIDAARGAGESINAAVSLARDFGVRLPMPGAGTAVRWSVLSAVAAVNLTTARVLEAHTDALAILADAGVDPAPELTWGVFAAEAPDARLEAEVAPDGRSATLSGVKPWCSIAADLDAALVTAHTSQGRRLFRVLLRDPTVRPRPPSDWVARGLRTVTSAPVEFASTPAVAVGEAGWYLIRPGFAWGGVGVAACWYGGACGVAEAIRRRAAGRDDDIAALHLGAADVALHAARASLLEAAALIDSGSALEPELLALRVRSVVVDAAELVLRDAAHALGPGPLAFDSDHAARTADLQLYIGQHHGERDLVALGRMLRDRV